MHAKQPQHLLERLQLLDERFGRCGALSLVLVVGLVTEGRAGTVQKESKVFGLFLAQQLQDHAQHHVQRVGRKAVGATHVAEGVEPAKEKGRAIDEVDGVLIQLEAVT